MTSSADRDAFLRALWSEHAASYAAAAPRLETYRASNRELVARLELRPGHRLLDLACGGGATLEAAFTAEPLLGPVWAVDWSAEMVAASLGRLAVLRGEATAADRGVVASAEAFASEVEPERVDRVICNSAFFQFPDQPAVLAEVARVLEPGGLFGFSLPGPSNSARFDDAFRRHDLLGPVNPSFGPPPQTLGAPERCTPRTAERFLQAAGWRLESLDTVDVETSIDEYLDWMLLPVFVRPQWRGLDLEDLRPRLRAAMDEVDAVPRRTWVLAIARLGSGF